MKLITKHIGVTCSIATLMLVMPILAQETRATLSGTITDQSGAAVVNATLHLINVDTDVEATTQSTFCDIDCYQVAFW